MIVGFPGETEDEFEQSLETCRQVGFMKIHIFPFSARAGTKAAEFTDKVAATTIRDRVDRMAALECDLALEYYQSLHGERVEVLVEQLSENRSGLRLGQTDQAATYRSRFPAQQRTSANSCTAWENKRLTAICKRRPLR